ncbi:HAF repeat-containing protein [Massilia genomosp. 1]|uniref:HAF repeat-containing protein n=1 Tax=Massilia genomosp. 1 TaxID=2609280 RepID=A0ABX0MMC0_9BURK|nr:HAF repeat-containing protein [Massilia genomosp. 1]NHZ63222.1 HAF repeat-containing protein [Massilia genomosp. 1]
MRPALPACLAILILLGGEASARPHPLGIAAPPGESTIAYDMNAAGQVAAVLEDGDGNTRGVLFEKGKVTDLGSRGGKHSDARGINDRGQIIGSVRNKNGSWNAFMFHRDSGMRIIGTLGGPSSYGMGLNQDGVAVGFADIPGGDWHAFIDDGGGTLQDLGTLGGKISYASGINKHRHVVGTAANEQGLRHAFLYTPAGGMVDLGTLGGRQSSAMAINDAGMVVGASETRERRWRAFTHDGKRMVDLGALIGNYNSFATDINNAGHVVGTVLVGAERMSFVWRDNKMTVHRGGQGLHLTNAINDRELVIGATYDHGMTAATMASNAAAVITRGGSELLTLIAAVLTMAGLGVLYRLRSRGIEIDSHG